MEILGDLMDELDLSLTAVSGTFRTEEEPATCAYLYPWASILITTYLVIFASEP